MYWIRHELPPLCTGCSALFPPPVKTDSFVVVECRRCREKFVSFLPGWLPTSEDFIGYYGKSVERLMIDFGHSFSAAAELARNYYLKFTNPDFCRSIGIAAQGDEFFFHEGNMADRIHYYLALGADPDPGRYIQWRTERYKRDPKK